MKRALLLILCLCLLLPAGALAAEACQPGEATPTTHGAIC